VVKGKDTSLHHGQFYREDQYERIRYEKSWQDRIIKRESGILNNWKKKLLYHEDQWLRHIMKRSHPGEAD
jgi:hypothetical protein